MVMDKPIEKSTLILFICVVVLALFSIYQFMDHSSSFARLEQTKLMENAGWDIMFTSSVSEGKYIWVAVQNRGEVNFLVTDFIIDGTHYGPTDPVFVPVQEIKYEVRFIIPFEWEYQTAEKEVEYRIQIITHSGKIIEKFRKPPSIN